MNEVDVLKREEELRAAQEARRNAGPLTPDELYMRASGGTVEPPAVEPDDENKPKKSKASSSASSSSSSGDSGPGPGPTGSSGPPAPAGGAAPDKNDH